MLKVGGEVDAFCSRCQLSLAHTVHAVVGGKPVKVECNTCHAVHRGAAGSSRDRAKRPSRAGVEPARFDSLLASKRVRDAAPYSPKRTYTEGDVVDHPVFGQGFVSAVRDHAKVEITFRTGARLLVHGRG